MKNILDKINRADEIQANLELDKTELGKHEVELASIAELQAFIKEGQTAVEKANALSYQLGDATNLWNKTFVPLKRQIATIENSIIQGYKVVSQINQKAKELGVYEIPEVKKAEGVLTGFAKTSTALRGAVLDNKNRMDTKF